jgi:hypothetical protein
MAGDLIATASLFLGQQKMFPEALRGTKVLFVPVIIVVAAMLYWLIRVRFTNAYRKTSHLGRASNVACPAV